MGGARAAAALAVLGVVAGCGGPSSPPRVTLDPLDVSHFVAQPCGMLTSRRAAERHLIPPGTPSAGTPVSCRWASAAPIFPSITADVDPNRGLADLHRHRGQFSYFADTRIAGYPATQTTTDPGGPSAGHCTVHVGAADHALVDVGADYPRVARGNGFSSDPCADADTVATEIVGHLAGGAP